MTLDIGARNTYKQFLGTKSTFQVPFGCHFAADSHKKSLPWLFVVSIKIAVSVSPTMVKCCRKCNLISLGSDSGKERNKKSLILDLCICLKEY